MFVLDEPYVSNLLVKTLKNNDYPVLNSKILSDFELNKVSDNEFLKLFNLTGKIYTNSENSIDRIITGLKETEIPSKINLFKDKIKCRELLKSVFPNYFFKKVSFDELSNLKNEKIEYPVVIKPSIGFLSFGVYTVWNEDELENAVSNIKTSMENAKGVFPESVLNADNFIVEEFIEGEEFAVDVYFDSNSNPVILNAYYHPFLDKNDVSDRMYVSSPEIIKSNFKDFMELFEKIGKRGELKNFPAHIELRKNDKNIIPIEINPLRFAGWCLCDLAYLAYGINVYEYFIEGKAPDWEKISKENKYVYAFIMGEVPSDINKSDIISFDMEAFKKDINAEVLEAREFDYKTKPMFCSLFVKADSFDKIKHVLNLDMKKYVRTK